MLSHQSKMSDFYPPCPDPGRDCRFETLPGMQTLLYSPVIYNRNGEPVGGGGNSISQSVRCLTCGKKWIESRKELEIAQGVKPNWQEVKREYER
jgi:hypothetical protein